MSLREVIDEIVRASPRRSPDEIGNLVVAAIESSLSAVFSKIRLPETPSPFYIGKKDFEFKRMGDSGQTLKEHLSEHDMLISDIAWLQRVFDGTASPSTYTREPNSSTNWNRISFYPDLPHEPVMPRETKDDNLPQVPRIEGDLEWNKQPHIQKNLETGLFRLPPSTPASEEKVNGKRVLKFTISPELQERLPSQKEVTTFVMSVEVAVRKFATSYKLAWDFALGMPKDIEEPDWRRIVLTIKPVGMDFDSSLKLWDRIDNAIRAEVNSRLERASPGQLEVLRDTNRNFFVELDLN